MSTTTGPYTRSKAIQNNLDLIKGNWPLSKEIKETMPEYKEILYEAAEKVVSLIEKIPNFDTGCVIRFEQFMRQAKDEASYAMIINSRDPVPAEIKNQ